MKFKFNFYKLYKQILILPLVIVAIIFLGGCIKKQEQTDLLKIIRERGKIVVGVKYDTKPFGFIDKDEKLKGFDIDLSREIAKRIFGDENAVEFQQVTSSNRIFALTSSTVDMVAATMTITERRSRVIDFSRPYYIAGQAILVPQNSPVKNLKDLSGKRVIVVLGSTSELNIRQLVPNVNILGFRTYTDAFHALQIGRGDAVTTDDTIIYGFLLDNKGYKMLKDRLTEEPYGIGFNKAENTKNFQDEVDAALQNIMLDGTLKRIKSKWIGNKP